MTNQLKYIGWYQVLGGIIGVFFIITSLLLDGLGANHPTMLILGFILYSISAYCGWQLLESTEKNKWVKISMLNQFLQAITFSIFGYSYAYISGVQLSLGLDMTNELIFNTKASLSSLEIGYSDLDIDKLKLMINFVPLSLITMLSRIKVQ